MKFSTLILAGIIVLSPTAFAKKKKKPEEVHKYSGVVQKCHDGDTCRVTVDNKTMKVRFAGIDTPELSQKYGKEAQKFTESLVKGKNVNLECDGKSFDRVTCTVFIDQRNINMEIVQAGWAYDSTKYSKGRYIAAVSDAKANRLGIWKDENLKSPFCYRHKSNKRCKVEPSFMP